MKLKTCLPVNDELSDTITNFIVQVFHLKNKRDSLIVSNELFGFDIKIRDDFDEDSINTFISDIISSIDNEYEVIVDCIFYKKIVENTLSLYSLEKYGQYLQSLSIENIIGKYNESFIDFEYIIFDLIIDDGCFYTKKFYFMNSDNKNKIRIMIDDRAEIIDKRDNLCNFVGAIKNNYLPDDFYFLKKTNDIEINRIFDRLTLAVSLTYISNISNINGDEVSYKIEGYKTVKEIFDVKSFDEYSEVSSTLWEIYDWVYSNLNNVSDKIGIARNILSLNLKNNTIKDIDRSVLGSIRSGYDIYLKENAARYIEVMNQQLIFINDINASIQKLALDFSHKFRNNFIGFFSFIFTTIIINVISTGTINNIFTYEITMICIVMLIISIVYLYFSLFESNLSVERIKKQYDRNKSFYKLILDEQDLTRILNNDSYYNEDRQYLDRYVKKYKWMWIIVVVILLVFLILVGTFVKVESIHYILSG